MSIYDFMYVCMYIRAETNIQIHSLGICSIAKVFKFLHNIQTKSNIMVIIIHMTIRNFYYCTLYHDNILLMQEDKKTMCEICADTTLTYADGLALSNQAHSCVFKSAMPD